MDIDIDVAPDSEVLKLFPHAICASRIENGELKKHNVGIHFQNIAVDPVSGLAAIPYNKLEDFGYYKIDILPVHILKHFESKQEMLKLQKIEPDWSLLEDEEHVKKLFHLGKHYDIINQVKPTSIIELADIFALIRPNKIKLLDKYLRNPNKIRPELFKKRAPEDMRKAHAIPYAILIVLQLHLIKEGRM